MLVPQKPSQFFTSTTEHKIIRIKYFEIENFEIIYCLYESGAIYSATRSSQLANDLPLSEATKCVFIVQYYALC